jgi:hypothetical protein
MSMFFIQLFLPSFFSYREAIQSSHEYKKQTPEKNLTPSKAYDR